jgi:hypothetical protein
MHKIFNIYKIWYKRSCFGLGCLIWGNLLLLRICLTGECACSILKVGVGLFGLVYFLAAYTIYTFQKSPISSKVILILSSHLSAWLRSSLFSSGFSTKTLHEPPLSAILSTCSDHLILPDLVTEQYSVRSTNHETNYAILCSPRVPRASSAQISSSAPNSQKSSTCVLPAVWKTNCHNHIKEQQNYIPVYFWIICLWYTSECLEQKIFTNIPDNY